MSEAIPTPLDHQEGGADDPRRGPAALWATRVLRRALLDADGSTIGTIDDVIVAPDPESDAPQLMGFVANVDRRQIFVHRNRVDAVGRDGVHLRGGTVDLRHFRKRQGELKLVSDVIGTPAPGGTIADVGFVQDDEQEGEWHAGMIAVASGRIRRKQLSVEPWSTVASRFLPDRVSGELARIRELHKADAAEAIQSLSNSQRSELTNALEASRLADVLEELPEDEQVEILRDLDTSDAVAVLDEMEIDDEVDLLKELPPGEREALLAAMAPDDVTKLRRLLSYREDTAGGMMNPEPIVLEASDTVAEAVARLRETELPGAMTMRLFVTEPPTEAPTGTYLGSVTLPRLLREPPTRQVGDCIGTDEAPDVEAVVAPSTPEHEVAQLLARYDLLSVAVVDPAERLVGVITIDDVLVRLVDRLLP